MTRRARALARSFAEGRIFEGGFARQWFIKKHLFKGSPLFRSDSQFDHDVCVTRIYKWMERPRGEVRGAERGGGRLAPGCESAGGRGRLHPMAIRRVAVIEVIAILCPVSSAVLAVVLFLSRPWPVFSRSLARTRCQVCGIV